MKSGPVFLWRGSVARLCEACQRLMIRWNIQTPATRRQAHRYVVIPNRGLAYADSVTFMHVHAVPARAHIHPPLTPFEKLLIYQSNTATEKNMLQERHFTPHLDEQIVNYSKWTVRGCTVCSMIFSLLLNFAKKKNSMTEGQSQGPHVETLLNRFVSDSF